MMKNRTNAGCATAQAERLPREVGCSGSARAVIVSPQRYGPAFRRRACERPPLRPFPPREPAGDDGRRFCPSTDLDAGLDPTAAGLIDKPYGRSALILEGRGGNPGALAGAWGRKMHRRRFAERYGGVRPYERIAGSIGARRRDSPAATPHAA